MRKKGMRRGERDYKVFFKGRRKTYFAFTQSSMVLAGFPVHIGSRSSAKRRGALIDPAPGNIPWALGNVLSSFVAIKRQSGFRVRNWYALESLV